MESPFSAQPSPAQLDELRAAIRHQLQTLNVGSTLADLVNELRLAGDTAAVKPDLALQLLQERGIVDSIARTITAPAQAVASATAACMVAQYMQAQAPAPSPR
ncbi:hypothetical protein HaLaN_00974 [Haematococcus lacustris]|uniref:Uncharacterized protein n=1 Tax=Haematococcus lacustris TaxID=44745 RepID=A0A699Y847_HAELA|nr:hypothetical protein HaLaN_00974 [Haematococcus lacustris]